jgi:hypothetical protein
MKSPREKALAYAAVVIIAGIVLFVIIGVIANRFLSVPGAGLTVP